LLGSVSSGVFLTAAKSNLLFAAGGPSSNGSINLGLSGITYYSFFSPFMNVWNCANAIQVVAGGRDYWANVTPGAGNSAWDGFLNSEGELVNPLPANVSAMMRLFYGSTADGPPEGYNRIGEQWVLKWEGAARNVTISGASSSNRVGNRIAWVWGTNTSNMWVTFMGMDRNNPPHNIRLCEARYERRLDAGEKFNPDWLAKVREGSGIVRFMDWQSTNFNRSTLRYSDFPGPTYCSYGGSTKIPYIKGGMPLTLMSALADQVQSHPWVCIPNVLGTNKLSAIDTITNSNPAMVKSAGHKWENGDQVIPYGTDWPEIEKRRWTVIKSDRQQGTFALAGMDSTSYGPYRSTWASVTSPFDLKSIASEIAPFAAHFRDNMAATLVTYFEFGNEIWNFLFNAPHWLGAQAREKFGRDDNNRMGGYLAAHCMKVIRDTYTIAGRYKWRGVLATQTVNIGVTNAMLAGVKQYIEENAPSLKVTDLFNDLAVTGYFSGPFNEKSKAAVFRWMELSEKRWRDGLEPTKYGYFSRVVSEDCADGRHTGNSYSVDKLVAFWRAQRIIADANGLELIQYEGGNHNNPGFFSKLSEAERARFMEFYRNSSHTVEDAENYKTMFKNFVEIGGKYPSKFVEMGPVSRYGNWGGLRYLGDSNSVWDAVVAFNGRH
jgi:hypothetical protein